MLSSYVELFVFIAVILNIALNSSIISSDEFNELTWGLAIGTIMLWIISFLMIAYFTGIGFRFQKISKATGQYVMLTFIGSLLLPSLVISVADPETHRGTVNKSMNNVAVIGLVSALWIIISNILDIMYDKNRYSQLLMIKDYYLNNGKRFYNDVNRFNVNNF